jgi:hypothetical protein
MAYDIVDQFEKRIKSRFSHRSVLLYDEKFEVFRDQLDLTFQSMLEHYEDKASLKLVHELALSEPTTNIYLKYIQDSLNNEYIL